MRYYIKEKGERLTQEQTASDNRIVGEDNGLGTFYTHGGWTRFCNIAKKAPDLLEHIEIINDKQEVFDAHEFLDKVTKFKRVYEQR